MERGEGKGEGINRGGEEDGWGGGEGEGLLMT